MKIYIFGYKGNMAARYRAILDYLGHEHGGIDVGDIEYGFDFEDADAFIVATPTSCHLADLYDLEHCGRPILCEKPITKDLAELEVLLEDFKQSGTRLQMVSQYDFLIEGATSGMTAYDYFKTGSDGLAWDVINIIKHAHGGISIRNLSPVWKCQINGQKINIGHMDRAYVEMMQAWILNPDHTDFPSILAAHRKCQALEDTWLLS